MLHIFTLNWNGKDKINELYNSFIKLNFKQDYIWHIKDNGSTDGSIELIESFNNKNINLIKYHDNLQNFAQGMNFIFNQANTKENDLILLLNNDVVFNNQNDLNKLISYFSDNSIGIVGCKLLYKNTDIIQHAGVVFNEEIKMPVHFGVNKKDSNDFKLNREFQVVTGAVLLIRQELYKNAYTNENGNKGMDESFHWAFDDVALCLSVKYKQNKKVICVGDVKIFHEESATLKKNPVNKLFMPRNVSNLLMKWSKFYSPDKKVYNNNLKHNLYKK